MGSNPAGDIYFHFEFSFPLCSEQVNGAVANEIKHVHSPEVIVVLDPDTNNHTFVYSYLEYSFKLSLIKLQEVYKLFVAF